MKRFLKLTLLLFLVLFCNKISFCQEFAPIGATWHVGMLTFSGISHHTIESVGDTIIEGKNCRVIDYPASCNAIDSPQFMYKENEKIFYYGVDLNNPDSMKFKLLIDFNAGVGESWNLDFWFYNEYGLYPDTVEVEVDSISYFYFNGSLDSLKIQHVSLYSDHFNNTPILYFTSTVIENIGFFDGLFPDFSNAFPCDVASIFETRCYEDSNYGLLKFVENECDYTGINDIEKPIDFVNIYPNPALDHLTIETQNTLDFMYQIFDSKGNKVLEGQYLTGTVTIPIADLKSGVYFIKFISSELQISKQFVKL